jgi:hypothetical protein
LQATADEKKNGSEKRIGVLVHAVRGWHLDFDKYFKAFSVTGRGVP